MTTVDPAARRHRWLDAGITGWRRVSMRLVWVELAGVVLSALVGLAVAGLAWLINPWAGGVVLALVLILAILRGALTPRRVASIGYVLREDDVVFRRGILFSRVVAVPYGRMQLVDVNRGPVARLLGLAELRLVTAAASSNLSIPGLAEHDAADLRDAIVTRAEERRVGL